MDATNILSNNDKSITENLVILLNKYYNLENINKTVLDIPKYIFDYYIDEVYINEIQLINLYKKFVSLKTNIKFYNINSYTVIVSLDFEFSPSVKSIKIPISIGNTDQTTESKLTNEILNYLSTTPLKYEKYNDYKSDINPKLDYVIYENINDKDIKINIYSPIMIFFINCKNIKVVIEYINIRDIMAAIIWPPEKCPPQILCTPDKDCSTIKSLFSNVYLYPIIIILCIIIFRDKIKLFRLLFNKNL